VINTLTIIIIAVSIIIIAIATVAIYYLHYSRVINKRLKERSGNEKRMLSPKTVGIVTIILALLIFSITIPWVRVNQSNTIEIDKEYLTAQYNYEVLAPQDMQRGYLASYSINDNAGYEKYEEILGNIRFTYFVSNDAYDAFHPAFLIFAEYIGPEDIMTFGFQGDYLTSEHISVAGKGGFGADTQEYICIIGNTSIDCIFQLSLFYYDEDGNIAMNKELDTLDVNITGNSADYAVAAETIKIVIMRTSD